jgi:hypothetical protein
MIGGHQPDGGPTQHALAVEHAPVREHLGEAQIVARRRETAGAAGIVARLLRHLDQLDRSGGERILVEGFGEPRELGFRHPEPRVAHLERSEEPLAHEVAEALARRRFDDAPEHVGGEAVFPGRAGLMDQRNPREALDLLGPRHVADVELDHAGLEEPGLRQRVLDGGVLRELAVGKAGGVAQEILDGHGPLRGHVAAAGRDLHVLECREPSRDRIRKLERAVLDQDHRGDRDHRLGHRVDPEDRVEPHGVGAPGIAGAQRARADELALAGDQHDCAGQLPVLDLLLERARDPREPRRRHSARFGRRGREAGGRPVRGRLLRAGRDGGEQGDERYAEQYRRSQTESRARDHGRSSYGRRTRTGWPASQAFTSSSAWP